MKWYEFKPANKVEKAINEMLLNERLSESLVRRLLVCLLKREGFWVKSPVNLWELIEFYEDPLEVLNRYNHPLQPDIDILCARFEGHPKTPLVAYEVKFFL